MNTKKIQTFLEWNKANNGGKISFSTVLTLKSLIKTKSAGLFWENNWNVTADQNKMNPKDSFSH